MNWPEATRIGWLLRPTLGRRIALAMVLSLVAVQAQAFLQIWAFSSPEIRMLGTRWLAGTVNEQARIVFAAPPDQRQSLLNDRPDKLLLTFGWSIERPWPIQQKTDDPIVTRFKATLSELLGETARAVDVDLITLSYLFPNRPMRIEVEPKGVLSTLGGAAIGAEEPDILIPASLRVAVQGPDGSWLQATTIGFRDAGFWLRPPITPLLAGGLIISIVSILIARWIVAPLDQLVLAARHVGNAREVVAVPQRGLVEFVSVALAFEEMQRRLIRFVDDRTQMLAAISHDLRSSLTRLRLSAEDCEDAGTSRALATEIDDMNAMLESTLAFAGGEAQVVPSQRTDLAALLISLADEATDAGRSCSYDGVDHAEVFGHPVSLKRAFFNLIDNAIKYGKTARISLETRDRSAIVKIADEGPGIPADRIAEALAPFRRLDPARSGSIPGAGLGLTIARDVIQSHGGTMELKNAAVSEDAHPNGLITTVTLPQARASS